MSKKYVKVDFHQLRAVKDFNIRTQYGDIDSLTKSIRENGLLEPLKVIKTKEKTDDKKTIYNIVDGHRRHKALTLLNARSPEEMPELEVEELPADTSTADLTFIQLTTGDGKEKLSFYEQAVGIKRLYDELGIKKAEIARRIGRSHTHVDDCLKLMAAPEHIMKQVRDGKLNGTTAVEIMKAGNAEEVDQKIDTIVAETGSRGKSKITKKDVERHMSGGAAPKKKAATSSSNSRAAADERPIKPPTGKYAEAVTELQDFEKALTNTPGATVDDKAMGVLRGIIKLLGGKADPIDIASLFISTEEPAENESKKVTTKEKAERVNVRQGLADLREEEKPKKKAAVKKSAQAAVEEIEEDETPAPVPAPKTKATSKKKAVVEEPEIEELDEEDIELEQDEDDTDEIANLASVDDDEDDIDDTEDDEDDEDEEDFEIEDDDDII